MNRRSTAFNPKAWFIASWDSPTFNSWIVFALKPLNFLFVLPLVLTRLPAEEVAVYYLFLAATALMVMLGLGFYPTFARILGYLLSGVSSGQLVAAGGKLADNAVLEGRADPAVLSNFVKLVGRVYALVALIAAVVALIFFSPFLAKPFNALASPTEAWILWSFILMLAPVGIYSNTYASFMYGVNAVPRLRRIEFSIGFATILTSCLALLIWANLSSLILAIYVWHPVKLLLLKRASRKLEPFPQGNFSIFSGRVDYTIFKAVWPASWREIGRASV